MPDDTEDPTRSAHPGDEVAALFRLAGRRERLPEAQVAPVRDQARAAWRRQVRRTRRRRAAAMAAAAAAVLAIVAAVVRLTGPAPAPAMAHLELQRGEVTISGAPSTSASVALGAVVATGLEAGVALRLAGGSSLRLDADSVVRLESPDRVALDRGALYLDSGGHGTGAVEVATPLGDVRHLGTQFEVRLLGKSGGAPTASGGALRVMVREGAVVVTRDGVAHPVRAGEELTWADDGGARRAASPAHGPRWKWAEASAPPVAIEGASLATYLAWAARETGLPWRFAEPGMAAQARSIVLHGSVEGLTPRESLAVVLPSGGFRHREVGGELVLERDGPR
jgi:ferric-dicitrate binding protein FerR (iron transport regulator)